MKRRLFALFGLSAAAQNLTIYENGRTILVIPAAPPVVNGQCPRCGKMARKLIKEEKSVPGQFSITSYSPNDYRLLLQSSGEELVRCVNCSSAFWQDGESK